MAEIIEAGQVRDYCLRIEPYWSDFSGNRLGFDGYPALLRRTLSLNFWLSGGFFFESSRFTPRLFASRSAMRSRNSRSFIPISFYREASKGGMYFRF